jgi:uncharacterized membrane protein YfcA
LETIHYIIIATFALVGLIQGISGFGGGLIAVPVLAMVLPLPAVIPIVVLQGICLTGFMTWTLRRYLDPGRFLPLIITGTLFTPVGMWILITSDTGWLKVLVGILIVFVALALMFNLRANIPERKSTYAATGVISGTLNGTCSIAGPPIVLLLANQGVEKQIFRANISLFFFIITLCNGFGLSASGLVTSDTLGYASLAIPAMLVGLFFGSKIAKRIAEKPFNKLVITIVLLSGINLFLNGWSEV